jgi:Protein of unknown function (DUF2934)
MATTKATPKKKPAPKAIDKKTTVKKASSTKTVAVKKVAAVKKTTPKKTAPKKADPMSGFERYKMIEVAAYYIAEKNGFAGNTADYWAAAEKEIDKKLAKK